MTGIINSGQCGIGRLAPQRLPLAEKMIQSMLIGAATALFFSLGMALFFYSRDRETDKDNHPALRFFGGPFLMLAMAVGIAAFAIYQWLNPANHIQPEELFVLSYIPAAVALLVLGYAVYLYLFRAVLRDGAIVQTHWPHGTKRWDLGELQTVEQDGKNTVLKFSDDKKFFISGAYSGRKHFLEALAAHHAAHNR